MCRMSGFVFAVALFSSVFGQEYTATLLTVQKCSVGAHGDEMDYTMNLNEEPDGSKSFSAIFNLTKEFNEECSYETNVQMMTPLGQYVDYMNGDGKACEGFSNMMKPAWDRLKQEIKPPIPKNSCTFKPGSYSLIRFQAKKDEMFLPVANEGRYRAQSNLYCNNVQIACGRLEVDVTEDVE